MLHVMIYVIMTSGLMVQHRMLCLW